VAVLVIARCHDRPHIGRFTHDDCWCKAFGNKTFASSVEVQSFHVAYFVAGSDVMEGVTFPAEFGMAVPPAIRHRCEAGRFRGSYAGFFMVPQADFPRVKGRRACVVFCVARE